MGSISRKYRVSIHDIASVNKIKNRHKIRVGQILTIPVPGQANARHVTYSTSRPPGTTKQVYTVRKGDTLGQIAETYKIAARDIRSWNGIKYGAYIYPGQKLTLWVKQS